MFPVLLFTLVTVVNVCEKGKFLLKETILSNAKENKEKNFTVYLRRKKIIPVQLMEQPTWRSPIVFPWIISFNLTSVLGIVF